MGRTTGAPYRGGGVAKMSADIEDSCIRIPEELENGKFRLAQLGALQQTRNPFRIAVESDLAERDGYVARPFLLYEVAGDSHPDDLPEPRLAERGNLGI